MFLINIYYMNSFLPKLKDLTICGDVEKNPGPTGAQKLTVLSATYIPTLLRLHKEKRKGEVVIHQRSLVHFMRDYPDAKPVIVTDNLKSKEVRNLLKDLEALQLRNPVLLQKPARCDVPIARSQFGKNLKRTENAWSQPLLNRRFEQTAIRQADNRIRQSTAMLRDQRVLPKPFKRTVINELVPGNKKKSSKSKLGKVALNSISVQKQTNTENVRSRSEKIIEYLKDWTAY